MSSIKSVGQGTPPQATQSVREHNRSDQAPKQMHSDSLEIARKPGDSYKHALRAESKFVEAAIKAKTEAKGGKSTASKKAKISEQAKLARSLRKPTPAELKEIQNAIQFGDKEKAIKLAIKYYNIDTSAAKSIRFDRNQGPAGRFDPNTGNISLGTSAFWEKAKISPDKLAAVLYHEMIHARHQKDPNQELGTSKQGEFAEEIEVIDENIRVAKGAGMEKSVVDELEFNRRSFYFGLTPENRKKVDRGDYDSIK